MCKATGQGGPRAPLFYCGLLLCGLSIAPLQAALAQSVDVSELERCAALASADDRLGCYEALTRETPAPASEVRAVPAEAPVAEAQPEPVIDHSAAASPEAPPEPERAAGAAVPDVADPSPVQGAASTPAPTAPVAVAPAVAAAEPVAAVADPMAGLGVDEPDLGVIEGRVTKVTKDAYGRLVFHFDNGQVWRQFQKRYFPHPKNGEFDVTISEGMMGDYRLQVEGVGRKVAIKRLR